jgi:hypothetical protein
MSNTMTIVKEAGSDRHTRRVVVRPPFPGDLAIASAAELDRPADEKPLARLHLLDQRLFY